MSDSSSLSEVEVSPSSDSLNTLIGLSTETGRTIAVSPSSLSEDQAASTDPTLASTDSSRPITPPKRGTIKFKMATQAASPWQRPLAAAHAAAAAASRPAAAHNTEGAATARGEATAPSPAVDLLLILRQMQEQQRQQQEQQLQQQLQQQQMLATLMQ